MAHAQFRAHLHECGIRMFLNVSLKSYGVEFAPGSPAFLGREIPFCGCGQIAINAPFPYFKMTGRFEAGTAFVDEFHHPLPQIKTIGFHALDSIIDAANVNVKCYSCGKKVSRCAVAVGALTSRFKTKSAEISRDCKTARTGDGQHNRRLRQRPASQKTDGADQG